MLVRSSRTNIVFQFRALTSGPTLRRKWDQSRRRAQQKRYVRTLSEYRPLRLDPSVCSARSARWPWIATATNGYRGGLDEQDTRWASDDLYEGESTVPPALSLAVRRSAVKHSETTTRIVTTCSFVLKSTSIQLA